MIEQPENQNNVLTSSVSQNPVASELDGDSIDSAVQNALTENALNQNKKTQILTPVQQLTPIENAVNETIKRNNESNKTALNQSLVSASAKDPDTVAKSQALAASLNVSTGVVDFDIELAKRQKLLRQAEVMKLVEKYPSLARRFLDKEFAEVAHDDMDNLAKTSSLSNQLRGNLPVGMGSGDNTLFGETATKYASEMFTDFERGMISGTDTTTYGGLAYQAQIPILTTRGLEQSPNLEQSIQYAESVFSEQEEYRGTWSESFGTIIGQMSSMMVEASAVGTAFGGAAALAGQLGPQIALPEEVITVPAAVSLGFTTSLIDQTRRVETGSAFVEYYRGSEDYEPLPYEEAAWAANIVGTLNASIELASTAFFFTPLANALPKAFLKKSIVNAFRKAITKSGATRAAATHLVKSTATEIGTEVVQEGTIVVAREITGVLTEPDFQSALNTQEGRDRLEERFSSIFEVTLKGTVPLAFITGGFGLAHQMRNIARSQKRQKLITDQIATKVESKVNKRSKTTYNSYLAEQLSGESLHIGVEQFEQARRKNGVGLQEVEKIIPGITEQVAKAKASGGDVVIPTSLYLSELIDTEFGVSIRNDIRADAEGMSINEIAESQEFLKELKSINKQAIEDFKKTNKDWAESAGKIEEEVFAKIKAAGNYTEEEARMLAQWHRDTAVVLASRFGMTPEQFNAKFGLSIESAYTPEQQAPAQGSFEQASRADLGLGQQAAPAPDSGVFDANNPPVSSEAIFALMDADGKIYYDINATMHGDLVETFPDITDTVIDGGFIVNGKYIMGKSDGGYSVFEGEQKQIDAVRNFTEQANTQGFQGSNYRPAVVAWAKEKFGDRTAPDGSTVWQNFTEWFGDSKVVDAEGKPMRMYHGTNKQFDTFIPTDRGIWFTPDKSSARGFASVRSSYENDQRVYEVYLKAENPSSLENPMADKDDWANFKKFGYDSWISRQMDGSIYIVVVSSPTQIKSAIANAGEFSATDPNMLRQAAVRQTPMPSVTTTNPVSPIGLAIASIPANGPKSIADSNTFFKKVWKKLLIATGKQIRSKSDDSVKAAAKLAVADIQDFLKGNTQFLDYYSQDWIKTKQLLDNYAGRPITNDEFQMYRIISGLTSPNTKLPSNISDTVKLWTHWMNKGSFDDFLLGSKPITKTLVVFESAESVSGTTANVKVRTIKIVADLTKKLGSVKAAIDYLREPVTVKELHAINKTLGYAGNVSNIGNIRSLVQMATGQDTLIPRMFIFGQKVGAYALNSIGDERFTTVDIWESRYIRSFFSGMFENEIGLPVDEKEHDTFVRFGYAFKDEMERVTGRTWTPSSLQALRWFYIIAATRAAGYSKASTSETISTYTNRVLQSTFDYDQSRETNATKSITTPPRRIEPKKYERDIGRDLDAKGITDPKQRREYTAWAWIQFARSNRVGDEVGFQFDTDRSRVSRRSRSLSGLATVATHTPGVRLVDALTKAGVSAQPYVELEPTTEGTKAFSDLVRKVNANSKFGTAVYVYSDADYAKKRLFISESGKSGFALSSDGDIVSVFSESGSREGRGAMILATQMGGTKLDCFDTILPGYYAAHGFRAVARVPWNDEFIPAGWDFDAFGQYNGGRPDVVYMVYEEKYLKPYSNTDGVVVSNPDEATAIQTKDIKTEADRAATSKARYAQLVRPLDSGGYDGGVGSSQVLDQSAVPAAFYSALSVEVGKSATKSASADSWKQQIKGLIAKGVIKEREVFWSGLDNWLDLQEGKITKEQVQAFLAAGGVKVEVQQKSDDLALKEAVETGTAQAYLALQDADAISEDIAFAFDELEEINAEGGDDYRRGQLHAIIDVALNEQFGTSIDDYIEGESEGGGLDAPTKYSRYQLPGGTNYREALVTLPERARDISGYTAKLLLGGVEGGLGKWQVMNKGRFVGNPVLSFTKEDAIQTAVNQEMPKAPQYNTPHWDQNNVLVHLRMNDRVDADGKKVLFVEEVQSDWGQAGREKGFVGETISDKLKSDSKKLFDDTQEKRTAAFNALQSIDHLGFDVFAAAIGAIEESRNWKTKFDLRGLSEQEIKDISDFLDARSAVFNFHAQNEKEFKKPFNIPTAPFVETTSGWLELGLKQILLEAVNGGYDRVAFVDGDQSVERYRKALTEAVDEIEINKNDDATYTYSAIRGGATVQGEQSVSAKRIGEVFGKAGSKQLLEQADANPNDIHTISSEDIEIGGEGMRKFYDTIVPQALNKMLKKLGGDKVGEVEIDTRRPEDNAYYADLTEADTMRQQGFTVTPALAAQVNQGLPLFQSAQNKPARGFFNPKQLKMMLGSKSDFTTFIHELAHYNLTVLGRIASDPQSPSQIREDMDTTLSWFGIAGETPEQRLANWNAMTLEEQRRHHETFAYNHEIYLSEGKSPSIEMQGVFERFGQFIKRIYISIRDDLNAIYKQEFGTDLPMMTGEIRRVMDRMIATDEQIRSAEERRNMENTFRDQELSGMDDAQWASYQQMRAEATQKSVSELNEQSLAATTWASRLKAKKVKEIEAEQEELRSEIRKQVKKEVESRNVYRAIKFLKYGILQTTGGEEVEFTGSNKLNANAVKLMVPKENMDKFGSGKNGMVALDGYHPDIVSERFNYSSGDELILAILDAKPMDEVIDGITEDRMEIENGELNSPQAIEAAADKAVHNEARVKLVAVELRWLTKATQPVRAMIAAAKSVAKQMLETKRLRDIKPGDYASAAARAAKESQTAYFASQSAETAAKTAYTRHYNKMIAEGAEEAKAVEMATKVSDEALAKAESRSEAHKKKYGKMKPSEVAAQAKRSQLLQEQLALEANDAIDQVKKSIKYLRNVLSDKNVQKIGADNSDQIALLLERFELKNISLKEMDKRTSLADWIAGQLELGLEVDISKELVDQANKISYRNMTLSQFNDLVDAVKTIEYMGKNENAILTAAKKAVFKEKRDEIVKSIIENAGDRKASTRTPKSGTIGAVTNQITRFLAAQFKAASVVRILDGGKDDGPLWNYLIRSANKSGDKETTMRATATEAVSKILNPLFKLGKMGGKGKFFVSVNESLNREEKLVIALNMGNEGNIQRMLDGYGWTLEQVIPILESMTTEELNAVQEIWDHFETYKNEISAKSRRIYGKDLDFVEPTPIQIKSASGEIVSLRGGYYPAKYDPMASLAAENYNEAEKAKDLLRAAHISATTSRGYSKQRAAKVVDRPLIRNLSALYAGLNEVIHDLSWHEWTIDANKLMRDNAFDKEIRERYGPAFKNQLKSWIKDVAAGEKGMDTDVDIALNFLRQGVSSAGLGFNLTSAAIQVTGFNQSIVRVGPKYIGYGIMQVMKRGIGAFREVNELSEFMANRSRTQFRELNELRNRVQGQSAAMKRVRMGTYFLMMKMQRSVDVPTWIGAYAKQLEINPDEQLAIDIADQTVIDTQGGGQIKDLSAVERGGAGTKLFTVFYGYMNTVYNMAAVETMTEKKRGKLAADYVMLFVVPVVLSYALKKLLKPSKDDDDEFDLEQIAKDLSIEQIQYLMGTMVVAREFSQIAKTMIDPSAPSMGYGGPAGVRMIGDTYTAATQIGQGEFDSAFRKSAINLIGDATGLPSAQINRTIDGIEALMEDETTDIRAPLFGVRK